jgi:hypothetical protein
MADWAIYDSTLGWLDLNEANGILIEEFEPAYPEVRTVADSRPGDHGVRDETRYFGSRSISIAGKFIATPSKTISEVQTSLMRYLLPNKRPVLRWTRDGVSRDIDIRVEKADQSIMLVVDDFNLAVSCPDPFWRTPTPTTTVVPYSDSVELGGDPWPWLGGDSEVISFESGTVAIIPITNNGLSASPPVITVYGPINTITMRNLTTNQSLTVAVDVGLNHSVVIDMAEHTVTLDNIQNVFGLVDFQYSEWWQLIPGTQDVMLMSDTVPTGDPYAVVTHHDLTL